MIRYPILALIVMTPTVAAADAWERVRTVQGIEVEARTQAGWDYRAHRATADVCTDLTTLIYFVRDVERFSEWLPDTEAARLIERTDDTQIHYIRTGTPWPFRDRDMVYRLSLAAPPEPDEISIEVTGLPDYLPERDGVVRMRSASGEWHLEDVGDRIRVTFALHVDPGRVPRMFANHRLAGTVGETLANLSARFPCPPAASKGD